MAGGLQARLDYVFQDPRLLERALTHRSFSATHNERLEFLGDSVLGLAVASLLYRRQDRLAEGELSRARAQLVNEGSLHGLALEIGLAPLLRLGEGEQRSGGRERASILADALEAVIGAVYLDGGYDAAEAVVHRLFQSAAIQARLATGAKDAKTALQEWLQGRGLKLPGYRVVATTGAAHRRTFEVACDVPERGMVKTGSGHTRRAGEQAAAAAALAALQAEG